MPVPIIFLIVILVGYPLIQLVAAFYARRRRIALARIKASLAEDERYSAHDIEVFERATAPVSGFDRAMLWALPVAMPAVVLAFALEILFGKVGASVEDLEDQTRADSEEVQEIFEQAYGNSAILKDDRVNEARDLSFEIDILRAPIPAAASIIAAGLVSPVFFFAYGIRGPLARLIRDFLRRSSDALRLVPIRVRT